nr:MAG TPA: outer capsid protein [Caudoviricetes sp.]
MELRVETPPLISGQAEDKIDQIYRYLFRLAEMLNTTGSLTATNSGGRTDYTALRSLIINAEKTLNDSIAAVRNEAGSNAASIAALTESVNTAAASITALQGAVDTLQTSVGTLETTVSSLEARVTALENKGGTT